LLTRQDVVLLNDELKRNTEITRSVDQKFGRSDVLWRSELAFRQKQLEELYGPIYGYLKSQKEIYDIWIAGGMKDKNQQVKELFSSQNDKIRVLIVAKAHLIEGNEMPPSFVRFVTSGLIFDLYATGTEEEIPQHLRADPRTTYPIAFNDHIFKVTEALKARIEALNREYAPPLLLPQSGPAN